MAELITGRKFENLEDYKNYYNSLPEVEMSDTRVLTSHEWFLRSALVRDTVEKNGPGSVFDIGIHTGVVSLNLAKLEMPVCGIDINVKAIEFCRAVAKRNNLNNCDFHVSAYEEYATERKFDYVIIQEIIEHVIDPIDLLEYAEKHCSGVVIVTTPEWDGPFGVGDKNPDHQWGWRAEDFKKIIASRGEILEMISNEIIYIVYKPCQK